MSGADVRVVVRKFDGSLHWHHTMQRLGEDEFALHQRHYGYPADVITRAEGTAAWLSAALRDGTEPFASRYRGRLDQVH